MSNGQSARSQSRALEMLESRRHFDTTFANSVDWSDIAYGNDGSVHLAYYDSVSQDLRYAMKPAGGSAWGASVVLDSTGDVGQYISIACAANGAVGISYFDATTSTLKYAAKATGWTLHDVDTDTSLYSSLAFQSNGTPVISYYDAVDDDLVLAHGLSGGTNWTSKYIIDSSGDVGRHSSLAIDPSTGWWAIAYEHTGNFTVKYAHQTSSAMNTFSTSVVDTNTGGADGISLAFKEGISFTDPGISYYDAGPANLRYLSRSSSGVWTAYNAATSGAIGLSTNLWYNPADDKANIIFYDKSNSRVLRGVEGATAGSFTMTSIQTNGGLHVSAAFGDTTDGLLNNNSIWFTYNPIPGSTMAVDEVAI
jgi:hypothetical protein